MSNKENDGEEAAADREKARCRRNRRASIQFIDKTLIRRRSSGTDKQTQVQAQRLSSINSDKDSIDLDHLQQYSENRFLFDERKPISKENT